MERLGSPYLLVGFLDIACEFSKAVSKLSSFYRVVCEAQKVCPKDSFFA